MPRPLHPKYGYLPDSPDPRDFHLRVAKPVPLPPSSDLRSGCPPVVDQGQLGSCTGNAWAGAVDFALHATSRPFLTPSRLFIYYNERVIEGSVADDAGAELRDGIKSILRWGAAPESDWAYDISLFAVKPPMQAYKDALAHRALNGQYSRVTQSAYFMRHCLGILKRPIVIGFTVYESFESDQVAQTGIVPMPGPTENGNYILDSRAGVMYNEVVVRSHNEMAKRKDQSKESAETLRLECLAAGAWYWFRAEGQDENMVSALNRMKYRNLVERFRTLNIPLPTPEDMYAYAAEKWPKHKLHPAPKAA